MGVKGLWQLLLPTGRRISIETLEGKTLAVDASIWLIQFMKVNTKRGDEDDGFEQRGVGPAVMAIAGFYRRICKLMYHGIRPIFVFDGDTPEIKLREIYARKERREKMNSFGSDERDGDGVKRLAKRLLVQNLKKQKVLKALLKQPEGIKGDKDSGVGLSSESDNGSGAFAPGFQLPRRTRQANEIAESRTDAGAGAGAGEVTNSKIEEERAEKKESDINKILSETRDYLDQHQNLIQLNATNQQNDWDNTIIINDLEGGDANNESSDDSSIEIPQNENDLDTETLSSLPTKTRIDVIEKVKRQQRIKSRQEFMSVAANPNSYSQCQLKNFLKSANLSKKINEVGQIASSKSTAALSTNGRKGRLSFEKGERIASDMTRRFIFTKDNGQGINDSKYDDNCDDDNIKPARVRKGDELNPRSPKRRRLKKIFKSQDGGNNTIDDSFGEDDSVLAKTDDVPNKATNGSHGDLFENYESSDNDLKGGFIPPSNYETQGGFIPSNDGKREEEGGFIESDNDGGGFINSMGRDSERSNIEIQQDVKMIKNKVIFELSSDEDDCNNEENATNITSLEKNIITIDDASDDTSSLLHRNSSKLDKKNKSSQCRDGIILENTSKGSGSSDTSEEESNDDVDWEDGETESISNSCADDMTYKLQHSNNNTEMSETEKNNDEWGVCRTGSEHRITDFGEYLPLEANSLISHDTTIDANALALEKARATAAGLTNWAGRAVQRAITAHLNESPEKKISQQHFSAKTNNESLDSNSEETETKKESSDCVAAENSKNEIKKISIITEASEGVNQGNHGVLAKKDNVENLSLDTLYKEVQMKGDIKRIQKDIVNTDDVIEDIIQLLHLFGIPYVKAPTEAEAQCATLEKLGLVDGVITEDSDAFVFGSKCVYKNIFDDKKYVEVYLSSDAEKLGLGVNEKIALAMLLGADYTEGVKGVGIVNGMEILHAFPVSEGVKEGLSAFRNWLDGNDFSDVIDKKGSCINTLTTEQQYFHSKHKSARLRWIVPQDFPSKKVLQAYTHPVVDTSKAVFSFGKPDVDDIRLFCQSKLGWDTLEVNRSLLPVVEKLETGSRQTRLDGYFMRYEDNHTISHQVKSKRLREVFEKSSTSTE